MGLRMIVAAAMFALTVGAPAAHAQAPAGDPTHYCEADGGPLGAATDLAHILLLGEAPLPARLRSTRISVAGVSTRVIQAGPRRAKDAVVFVHGSPGSARDFDHLAAAAGRFTRTVAFDISGYGESDHFAPQVQSTDGAAGYIGGVLDELGIRRAVLVAHDFGGPWALQWAVAHPKALTGAVLINSGVLIDYVPHPFALTWATPGAGELQMASTRRENFKQALQAANPRGLPDDYLDRMYDNYDRATRCAALRYYRSAVRPERANIGREQAAVLSKRRRPALVIWGEGDIFIPPRHAEDQRRAFPDAQIHMFEDSGHWPFVDNAKRTRRLFVSFLRPKLDVRPPRVSENRRRIEVPVRVKGVLPAHRVRARLRGTPAQSAPIRIARRGKLLIRPWRQLRPGRYVVDVRARGLPRTRTPFRLRAGPQGGRQ